MMLTETANFLDIDEHKQYQYVFSRLYLITVCSKMKSFGAEKTVETCSCRAAC